MKKIVKKTLLNIKPYVPGKPIEEVKRALGLKRVIKLASNESPYGPSPKVLRAIEKASRELNRYPDGNCYYLRQALAKHLHLDPQQFIFGNGSDELIVLAVRAFVREGDEVVMARPSFLIYEIASKIAGANIQSIPLKNFRYDLAAMKRAIGPKTRLVFLGNPDNPAGSYLTQREMREFLRGLKKDVLVFMDEAYFEYVTAKDYADTIGLLATRKNIMVIRTFSKMYGLAGLRIGYGMAHPELIDFLNRIREPFNVNALAQAAALACLKDKAYYRRIAREIKEQRQFLYASLESLGLRCVSSHTNFILVDVKKPAEEIVGKLLKRGIIIRDMKPWGLNNFIRITIGKPAENKAFINALKDILR